LYDESVIQRFWSKVEIKGEDECWIWKGSKARGGYGHININGKYPSAHRVAYEIVKGEIPPGMVLDHLCRNPSCVNPNHLEPVTYRENLLRGVGITAINAAKTHCPRGHEYTEENTYISKRNQRTCRTCARELQRERRRRQRGNNSA
jgi:HNH endonuclease